MTRVQKVQKGGDNITKVVVDTLEDVLTIPSEVLDNLNDNVRRLANLDNSFLNEYYNINGTNQNFKNTLSKLEIKDEDWKNYQTFLLENRKIKDFKKISNEIERHKAILYFIKALKEAGVFDWWYITGQPSLKSSDNYNGATLSGSANLKIIFELFNKATSRSSSRVYFKYTSFLENNLDKIAIKNTTFQNCYFKEVDFEKTTFDNCKFIGCLAQKCDFKSTRFTDCEVDSTDFQYSSFVNSIWEEKQVINNTNFNSCNLKDATFNNLIIKGNTTFMIDLMMDSKFSGVNFQKGVKFSQHERRGEYLYLRDCIFNEINFDRLSFYVSKFDRSKFISCSLIGTQFEGCDLDKVSFTGSTLRDVILNTSSFDGANIEDLDFNVIVNERTTLRDIHFNERTQFHPQIRAADRRTMSENLRQRINAEFRHLPPLPPPQPTEGIAFEVHNAADGIDISKLTEFMTKYLKPNSEGGDPVEKMKNYINTKFPEGEREQYGMKFNAVITKLPRDKPIVDNIFNYVLQQPNDFIEYYLKSYTQDCYHAYQGSSNTMSCVKGIYERTYLTLGDAAFASCSAGNCNTEYNELLVILKNVTLDINELTQKWSNSYLETPEIQSKFENIGNMSEEDVATLAEKVKQNYIAFMEDEYESKGLLDDNIRAKIKGEADKLDYAFKSGAFGGGRRKRRMGVTRQKKRSSNGKKTRKKKRGGNRK